MFCNFWRISAYFRRSCFCSCRLSGFDPGTKKAEEKSRNFSSAFFKQRCNFVCFDQERNV
ncbi:hypothetical protein [Enterococcus faecalis]|uniref:hypothetical protein n=1 Tax=Enterococcus faecalis TaxID=1351 RepID=UPI002935A75D|nr:hypothetical protein [Enterococcus faecalis]MDV2933597.1 hypothetical protein [Enterococcus faecalis]